MDIVKEKKMKPKNLLDCIKLLLKEDFGKFKDCDEKDILYYHHTTGRKIRNDYDIWNKESELHKWFNSIGINHPDDMSGIILITFHRILNRKPVKLKKQIDGYTKYWDHEKNNLLLIKTEENKQKIKDWKIVKE